MKKFVFSLSALMVVAMAAFTFVSCTIDETDDSKGLIIYGYGFTDRVAKGSITAEGQIEKIYETQFKKLSNTQSVSGGDIITQGVTIDSEVYAACTTAQKEVEAEIADGTINLTGFWGKYEVNKTASSGNSVIYTHEYGTKQN